MIEYTQPDLFDDYLDEGDFDVDQLVEVDDEYSLYQTPAEFKENTFIYRLFDDYNVLAAKWESPIDSLAMTDDEYEKSNIHKIFVDAVKKDKEKKKKEAEKVSLKKLKAKDKSYYSWYDELDDDDNFYSSGKAFGSYYKYTPKPKSTGFLDKLNKSDTLVIHCADRSTDMLSQVYEGKNWDVLTDGNIDTEELHQLLKSHDRLVFLGHGTGSGLINVQGSGTIIGASEAEYLKGKKIFAIWCNADKYFTQHHIGQSCFITKNVPSEVWEAAAVGYHVSAPYILENIIYWSKCCADVVDDALNGNAAQAVEKARKAYQDKYGPESEIGKTSTADELGVTQYNTDAIQVQK